MPSSTEYTDNVLCADGYRIVRVHRSHMDGMQDLYQAVYGKALTTGYYVRKYDTGYTGIRDIGFIAYKDTEAAAYYGVIPCYLRYQGQLILAAQSADTMTHPRHQKKGLFTLLANLTYDLCKQEGIRLLFGFPNQHSLPGFVRKLGWHIAGHMACFNIHVNTFPLGKMAAKYILVNNLYTHYCNRVLKKQLLPYPGIANSDTDAAGLSIDRSVAYLDYKTYHQTLMMEINGMQVWFKIKEGLIIGDIKGDPTLLRDAPKVLKKIAFRLGLDHIHIQAAPQSLLYAALHSYYPSFPTFPIILKAIDPACQADLGNIAFTYADIDIF